MHEWVAAEGIKIGDIVHAVRVAVTGKAVGFGLFDTLAILGRERCLARIDRALARCRNGVILAAEKLGASAGIYPSGRVEYGPDRDGRVCTKIAILLQRRLRYRSMSDDSSHSELGRGRRVIEAVRRRLQRVEIETHLIRADLAQFEAVQEAGIAEALRGGLAVDDLAAPTGEPSEAAPVESAAALSCGTIRRCVRNCGRMRRRRRWFASIFRQSARESAKRMRRLRISPRSRYELEVRRAGAAEVARRAMGVFGVALQRAGALCAACGLRVAHLCDIWSTSRRPIP